MKKRNKEIRQRMDEKNVRQWQVAEAYGMDEGKFSRMMRHELEGETRMLILTIIEELAAKK
ncbi:hypothetical protein [Oceanirhabdus seepicola]|uniref:XRE family transcriptional regulator n=1 Tax=Oceanirhabdus seepicola TaxID=2828781 RepID=A0A9J6P519_9CLOT|nr:hypothetical protein [Oceanirhabdus seepicola]MCM1991332.1 hypothetical protein [Oceanirhabdus seepicola]